jgi:hypothetical protein
MGILILLAMIVWIIGFVMAGGYFANRLIGPFDKCGLPALAAIFGP